MAKLKLRSQYYFSTEGETELWYLKHLEKMLNSDEKSVSFIIKKASPSSFVKGTSIMNETVVHHVFDVESAEKEYEERFMATLDNMKKAERLGKSVSYFPAYTNLTFELWMILHKLDCKQSVCDRKNYLSNINKAFNVKYKSLKEYKEKEHFKQILRQITIADVRAAVDRADKIMQENRSRGYTERNWHNYTWYLENPSTEVGSIVKKILQDCGLIKKQD